VNNLDQVGKDIFMRARAGNINISFQTDEEAKDWEKRLVSKLEEAEYKIKKIGQ
jgi:hypothetical protein